MKTFISVSGVETHRFSRQPFSGKAVKLFVLLHPKLCLQGFDWCTEIKLYNKSPQGFCVHGILQARILELNLGLLHYRQVLYHLSHQESQ